MTPPPYGGLGLVYHGTRRWEGVGRLPQFFRHMECFIMNLIFSELDCLIAFLAFPLPIFNV